MPDDAVKIDAADAPLEDQLEVFLTGIPNQEMLDAFASVLRRRSAAIIENEDADCGDPTEDDADDLAALAAVVENAASNLSC